MSDVHRQLQLAYPQAFSILQASLQDWALAEDVLQDAVERALLNWPGNMPSNPVAWLITAAKHRAIDQFRRDRKQEPFEQDETDLPERLRSKDLSEDVLGDSIGDDVLRLMLGCCHPALAPETQLALTLKHVMSFTTAEIASALLVSEKSMEQRLTRAKQKITALQLSFDLPSTQELNERLPVVLHVLYLLYNEGYSATAGLQVQRADLCREAIRLTRWLHTLIRHKAGIVYAELLGLLALMISQQARAQARSSAEGELILLAHQDRTRWDRQAIIESQVLVEKALRMGRVGPYQIQAAISALHNQAASYEETDWTQIRLLYQTLLRQQDTPVIRLNYGIALAKEFGAEHGLRFIETLRPSLTDYLPFYAAIGALHRDLGQHAHAIGAFEHVVRLSDNAAVSAHFKAQICQLSGNKPDPE